MSYHNLKFSYILFENAFFLRKPSRPKSGDPMRISLTLDIEDNTALNGNTFPHPCHMNNTVNLIV